MLSESGTVGLSCNKEGMPGHVLTCSSRYKYGLEYLHGRSTKKLLEERTKDQDVGAGYKFKGWEHRA